MHERESKRRLAISKGATLRVVRFYLILGCAWILVTDGMVYVYGGESLFSSLLSMGKGLIFVFVTGIALYMYMTRWAHENRKEAETLSRRITQLSRYANDIVLLFDRAGHILEANDRAAEAYGYPLSTLLGINIDQLREKGSNWRKNWDAVQQSGDVRFESVHRRADGTYFPVEVSSRRIDAADCGGAYGDAADCYVVQSIIRDISERKEAERKIIGLKDVYAALSQTNQTIVRVADRGELFQSICDIAIEYGHFQLAWIGIVDEATKEVVAVAKAGTEVAYLEGVRVSAEPQSEFSTGPSGQAIVTGAHVIANDLLTSMQGKPWKIRWERFDMKSSAGFPLLVHGSAIGALTLYSKHAGFFTEDLIDLLDEMALDISYALERMEADRERLRLGEELMASNARVQGIVEGTEDMILAVDKDMRLTLCNRAQESFLAKRESGAMRRGEKIDEWLADHPSELGILAANLTRALGGERVTEIWSLAQGSDEVYFESYFAPLLDPHGERIGAFHVGKDVSEHRKMESELLKLTTAVEQSPVTVVITDTNGAIQYVNPAFTATTGYTAAEALGQNPRILKSGETSSEEYQAMWKSISSGYPWFGLFHNRRKDGTLYWEEAVVAPVRDAAGAVTQYIAMKQDVTSRLAAEERASFLTLHDPLTNLPNRALGRSYMEEAMAEADKTECLAALFSLDVDNFKRVNDSLGYRIGDLLIQAIATRLQDCLGERNILIRTGGDQFLIVLSPVAGGAEIDRIATAILNQARTPFFSIEGFELTVTLSIGVAVYPDDSKDFDVLHKQADMAMSVAKKSGRNGYRFYAERMESDAKEYHLVLNGLPKALERGEFVLHYQPQFSVATGKMTGAEALIRWAHPELGMIPPGRFIGIAEDSGLIVEVGQWVLETACRQAARWRELGLGQLVIGVNLSAVQFRRGGLAEIVRKALADADLDPCCLNLELTESILIENDAKVSAILKELKALGVSLSLDDFGTGYASFAYLRNFDLDELKIDQSFVREVSTNKGDERIVQSIIELAKGFGLRTVAEGVENADALEVIRAAGCDYAQGFYLARPMTSEALSDYLRALSDK